MITRIEDFRNFINEKVTKIFGNTADELLALYRADDEDVDETDAEIKYHLDNCIKKLQKVQKKEKIKLYRLVYIKNPADLNTTKLGLHYVSDMKDFHEQMIDYLYRNAWEIDKTLDERKDSYIIVAETPTSNINYYDTIRTNMMHPWESELTVLNDKNVKFKSIKHF